MTGEQPTSSAPDHDVRWFRRAWEMAGHLRLMVAYGTIIVALSLMLAAQVKLLIPLCEHNSMTFLGHGLNLKFGAHPSAKWGEVNLDKAWKPRILSNVLASRLTIGCVTEGVLDGKRFADRVGLWVAIWLGAILVVYTAAFGARALIFLLGSYCGLAFGYMPGIADRVYPWDMPAVFFFGLFVCLLHRNKLWCFLPLIPVAVLFKETCAVLCVGFLFMKKPLRGRLTFFLVAAALAFLTKSMADVYTHSIGRFDLDFAGFVTNLEFLMRSPFSLLINAGLLMTFLVMPFRSPHAPALRVAFALFCLGNLIYGVSYEYRIWFELIPFSLYALTVHFFPDAPALHAAPCARDISRAT